ncbi:hypothetical protein P872_21880 [Rhodonellum psychrophilum GCM71 = DSM 17998]|uniref:Uncharacterized protein n=2 Tax=Rhodonellum TaxID=336827 RepID=U5BWZ5_9BACT|nr:MULTISPECIES: hypothetical protein [Rhodonellum]ERM80432.1 hypothetical protein P872_21880 [Rhodonellum psychrophilum GCM71 = DSM 17998]SDZ24821.1 hypothetical protein SAMN05444412_108106 [Rhodonellum ikkaensis]
MKKYFGIAIILFLFNACSNKDVERSDLIKGRIEVMTGQEVIQELLIENDTDIEQIARIFNCSVPTLNRVLERKSYLTNNALEEFKQFLVAVKILDDNSFIENDPLHDYWIIKFRSYLDKYVWWAGYLLIFGIVVGAIVGFSGGDPGEFVIFIGYINLFNLIMFSISYLFAIIVLWIFPYVQPEILYSPEINTVFETLI